MECFGCPPDTRIQFVDFDKQAPLDRTNQLPANTEGSSIILDVECVGYNEVLVFSPLIPPNNVSSEEYDDQSPLSSSIQSTISEITTSSFDLKFVPKSLFLPHSAPLEEIIKNIRKVLCIGTAHGIAIHDTRSPLIDIVSQSTAFDKSNSSQSSFKLDNGTNLYVLPASAPIKFTCSLQGSNLPPVHVQLTVDHLKKFHHEYEQWIFQKAITACTNALNLPPGCSVSLLSQVMSPCPTKIK